MQRIKLVFYERNFLKKIIELLLQKTENVGVFIAINLANEKHRVVSNKSRLTHLTSQPNLFSPFPFRSTNHSGADTFHHKSRRTSTCTRTGLHRSLTTVPSRILLENHRTQCLFPTRTPKENTTLTDFNNASKHLLPTCVRLGT